MKYIGKKDENVEYRKRPGAYAIIVNKNDDKIGIVKVITDEGVENFYVGGGIEEGETKLEALKREMIEEAGYTIKNIKELEEVGSYIFAEDHGYIEVIASVYIAEFDKKVAEPIEKDHNVIWVKPEEIADKMYFEYHRHFLNKYIKE